jgi:hypothetical protein
MMRRTGAEPLVERDGSGLYEDLVRARLWNERFDYREGLDIILRNLPLEH